MPRISFAFAARVITARVITACVVTARIIDASGQPIKATRAETETEEVPSLTSEKTLGMAR